MQLLDRQTVLFLNRQKIMLPYDPCHMTTYSKDVDLSDDLLHGIEAVVIQEIGCDVVIAEGKVFLLGLESRQADDEVVDVRGQRRV